MSEKSGSTLSVDELDVLKSAAASGQGPFGESQFLRQSILPRLKGVGKRSPTTADATMESLKKQLEYEKLLKQTSTLSGPAQGYAGIQTAGPMLLGT